MVTDKGANRRLSDKLGFTPEKKQSVKKEPKASPKKDKKPKKNPWSDSDMSSDDSDANEDFEVEKKVRDNVRRNAATNKYKDYMSGSSSSDSEDDSFKVKEETNGVNGNGNANGNGKLVSFEIVLSYYIMFIFDEFFLHYRILPTTKILTVFSNPAQPTTNQVPKGNLTKHYLTTKTIPNRNHPPSKLHPKPRPLKRLKDSIRTLKMISTP